MNLKSSKLFSEDRLLSLDFFRGITMFLLVAEGTHLWSVLVEPPVDGTVATTKKWFASFGMAAMLLPVYKTNIFQSLEHT